MRRAASSLSDHGDGDGDGDGDGGGGGGGGGGDISRGAGTTSSAVRSFFSSLGRLLNCSYVRHGRRLGLARLFSPPCDPTAAEMVVVMVVVMLLPLLPLLPLLNGRVLVAVFYVY